MGVATDDSRRRRGRWPELKSSEQLGIVCSVVATVLAIPFAVVGTLYLKSKVDCTTDTSWSDPMLPLGVLGTISLIVGIAAGTWAAIRRPRLVGLATIAVDLGLLILGVALTIAGARHTPLCIGS
jgi:ABC-type dipeptide/oligopeptide/nickel transport system permease component